MSYVKQGVWPYTKDRYAGLCGVPSAVGLCNSGFDYFNVKKAVDSVPMWGMASSADLSPTFFQTPPTAHQKRYLGHDLLFAASLLGLKDPTFNPKEAFSSHGMVANAEWYPIMVALRAARLVAVKNQLDKDLSGFGAMGLGGKLTNVRVLDLDAAVDRIQLLLCQQGKRVPPPALPGGLPLHGLGAAGTPAMGPQIKTCQTEFDPDAVWALMLIEQKSLPARLHPNPVVVNMFGLALKAAGIPTPAQHKSGEQYMLETGWDWNAVLMSRYEVALMQAFGYPAMDNSSQSWNQAHVALRRLQSALCAKGISIAPRLPGGGLPLHGALGDVFGSPTGSWMYDAGIVKQGVWPRIPIQAWNRFHGIGALGATQKDCAPGAMYSAGDDTCYCAPGFESSDTFSKPCVAISVKSPCADPTNVRSPIDKKCKCPPGTTTNPDFTKNDCVPGYWFPNCVDAAGNSVPNCFLGMPMNRVLPLAVGGIAAGLVLGFAINALR